MNGNLSALSVYLPVAPTTSTVYTLTDDANNLNPNQAMIAVWRNGPGYSDNYVSLRGSGESIYVEVAADGRLHIKQDSIKLLHGIGDTFNLNMDITEK